MTEIRTAEDVWLESCAPHWGDIRPDYTGTMRHISRLRDGEEASLDGETWGVIQTRQTEKHFRRELIGADRWGDPVLLCEFSPHFTPQYVFVRTP